MRRVALLNDHDPWLRNRRPLELVRSAFRYVIEATPSRLRSVAFLGEAPDTLATRTAFH
jgi:hypothetical protein